jgi:hypothetical protein
VVAHADAESRAHPEQEERDSKRGPTEHEKCGDSSDMKKTEGDAVGPVNFLLRVSYVDQVGGHGRSPGMNRPDRWINTTGSRWADAGMPQVRPRSLIKRDLQD